jgi:hypothetical protein
MTLSATALSQPYTRKYCVDVRVFDLMVNEVIAGRLCDSVQLAQRRYIELIDSVLANCEKILLQQGKMLDIAEARMAVYEQQLAAERKYAETFAKKASRDKKKWVSISVLQFVIIVLLLAG